MRHYAGIVHQRDIHSGTAALKDYDGGKSIKVLGQGELYRNAHAPGSDDIRRCVGRGSPIGDKGNH